MIPPRVGVAVFVMLAGKFVMLKRTGSHGAGTWSVPGGSQEYGEHWFDTARRETLEETNVHIENLDFLTITNDMIETQHWVTIWTIADYANGEFKVMEPHKCTDMQWFTFDTLPRPLFGPWDNLFMDPVWKELHAIT